MAQGGLSSIPCLTLPFCTPWLSYCTFLHMSVYAGNLWRQKVPLSMDLGGTQYDGF